MVLIKKWLIEHWRQRIWRWSSAIALIVLYLDIFHNAALMEFVNYLFNVLLKKLIENIVNDADFVKAIGIGLSAYLFGTKKF